MAFGVDYKQAAGGLIPEGIYEVIVKYAVESVSDWGKVSIEMPLIIRNDIEQERKNSIIWHRLYKLHEPTALDLACNGYSNKSINILSKAAGLPNGKKYESLEEWMEDMNHQLLQVEVRHQEYNGNTSAKVKYINPTKFPICQHVYKDQPGAVPPMEMEDDDDLPF